MLNCVSKCESNKGGLLGPGKFWRVKHAKPSYCVWHKTRCIGVSALLGYNVNCGAFNQTCTVAPACLNDIVHTSFVQQDSSCGSHNKMGVTDTTTGISYCLNDSELSTNSRGLQRLDSLSLQHILGLLMPPDHLQQQHHRLRSDSRNALRLCQRARP